MSTPNHSKPLVSVIIPTYNYGHYIGEALQSIQAQSYSEWECIVVDDGSTDNTNEVLARKSADDSRIHYVRQENSRQAAARNNGIAHAHGDYFQFLDADDLIEPEKFRFQTSFLEGHPETDIIYSGVRYFTQTDPDSRLLSRQYSRWEDGRAWMPEVSGAGDTLLLTLLRNNIMVV